MYSLLEELSKNFQSSKNVEAIYGRDSVLDRAMSSIETAANNSLPTEVANPVAYNEPQVVAPVYEVAPTEANNALDSARNNVANFFAEQAATQIIEFPDFKGDI